MTGSNTTDPTQPVAPLTPRTPTEPEDVVFHERVTAGRGRSTATRVGVITGSALLVLVGVAAVMGASPSPATTPTSGVGADPSAAATAPAPATSPSAAATGPAPATSAAPGTKAPDGTRPDRGPLGGLGFRGGFPGFGFHDITITAIDGSSISLTTEDGWTRTIAVTDTTTITKGGTTIALADLAVGDQIQFRQDKATDGTYTVTAIVVVLPTVVGEISAIDGDTITISQPGGTTATVHVDSSTTYRLANGTASLSDLKVGTVIVAEGTQRADGSLDAASIRGGFAKGGFGGPGFQAKPGFPDGLGGDHGPNATPAVPAPSSGAS